MPASRVALRKESVDRNTENAVLFLMTDRSLSARRAWIEILVARPGVDPGGVALRKESVDRNFVGDVLCTNPAGRSPQGERR